VLSRDAVKSAGSETAVVSGGISLATTIPTLEFISLMISLAPGLLIPLSVEREGAALL